MTSITIPNSVTSIGSSAFAGCSSLTSLTFEEDSILTSLVDHAFTSCNRLTSITLPDSVTSIGNYVFSNCSSLTSIIIPNSTTSIGDSAFKSCYSLIEVFNKSSLDIIAGSEDNGYIGYYAKNIYTQEGGSKLSTDKDGYIIYTDGANKILVKYTGNDTQLFLPSGITKINQGAFYNCRSLTSITLPDSVTSIGYRTFYECRSLTNITIPNSTTSIGDRVFDYCYSLRSINFQGTKSQWSAIRKGYYWDGGTSSYTVYCTDGNIG